jgi:hypothetical protein
MHNMQCPGSKSCRIESQISSYYWLQNGFTSLELTVRLTGKELELDMDIDIVSGPKPQTGIGTCYHHRCGDTTHDTRVCAI